MKVTMSLEGKHVVVLGLARTGLAAARFAAARGAAVTVSDRRSEAELGEALAALSPLGVRSFLGGHPDELFEGADWVVVSPGVPLSIEPLRRARERGLRVVGDVEFVAPMLEVPAIAVTGTNGKSTVTSLCGQILEQAGRRPFVGANLGRPIFDALGEDFSELVLELSSYQIETLRSLHPMAAVLLNVTEDHLDRYDSFEHYRLTKQRLLELVPQDGAVVVNLDDPACRKTIAEAPLSAKRRIAFTIEGRDAPAAWGLAGLEGDEIVLPDGERVSLRGSSLVGRHNLSNQLAAAAAARAFGVPAKMIEQAIASFRGLPHRCEPAGEVRGVRYYDDSKGTNVAAVAESLRGFDGPVVLIAGGVSKHGSYAPLVEAGRGRLKHAVLIGEARHEIAEALKGVCPSEFAASIEEAVALAAERAKSGDVVLLGPACASFDMFRDYAERGDRFQVAVKELAR